MPRTCTICTHAARAQIESAIVVGTSGNAISALFRVSEDAIQRHKQNCVRKTVKASRRAQEEASALDVVKQLKTINAVTLAILKEARAVKANGLALSAIDRVQKQIELQAKLLGDLDERPQVNVWLPASWQDIELAIRGALGPYPDARVAVAGALARLENGRAGLN